MTESSAWTEERVERLRVLWAEGLSCIQIAGELGGTTRNAVIGKANRLKLGCRRFGTRRVRSNPKRPAKRKSNLSPAVRVARPVVRAEAEATPPPPPVASIPRAMAWQALTGSPPVPLVDLPSRNACKWPLGDGAPWMCCAMPAEGTYCPEHQKLSVRTL